MPYRRTRVIATALVIVTAIFAGSGVASAAPESPGTFIMNGAKMAQVKANLTDPTYKVQLANLVKVANAHLSEPLYTVTDKPELPPSGNIHDFMTLAQYWWPNPNTPDGLPYVYRDGVVNPEYKTIPDHDEMQALIKATSDLSTAYYFTGDPRYSDKAALMLRTWFINPATRMNPNLQYTATIKGKNNGDSIGIIEGAYLPKVVDAVKVLQSSPSWTGVDNYLFAIWMTKFYQWLTTSANGLKEAQSPNNHGTFYTGQLLSYSLFLGNHVGAAAAINKARGLIDRQILPTGIQPFEASRSKPWDYQTLNVGALMTLASMAQREGVDLWNYTSPTGGSIRKVVDFLDPYANGTTVWTYPDIDTWRPWTMQIPLRMAATAYNQPAYSTDATTCIVGTGLVSRDYSLLVY